MAILAFTESIDGKFHKPAFELLTYASDLAALLNTEVVAVTIANASDEEIQKLSKYGASKTIVISDDRLKTFTLLPYCSAIGQVAQNINSGILLFSNNFSGKSIAARLAARFKAGIVTGVNEMVDTNGGFVVKKPVYSGKGFGHFNITSPVKILTVGINTYHISEKQVQGQVEIFTPQLSDQDFRVKVIDQKREKGKVSLTEAEIIVSGGRGMKGPENWKLLEDLADVLRAGLACSKPVADVGWRPHHEHVGQTGLTVSPDLYIAVGISGAIQHLAGVSSSKVIVVINKDPEAPFFKAADYAIVGDAFQVLPKLTDAARKLKSVS